MRRYLALVLLLFTAYNSLADSPITSTTFYTAYEKHKMVKYALKAKKVDKKIAKFLTSKKAKLAEKAAVINAISWDINGQKNAETFMNYIKEKLPKYSTETDNESRRDIQFCYAYLLAMDDYFDVEKAAAIMETQIANYPDSYTAQIVIALVKAQNIFGGNWCEVWKLTNKVDTNTNLKADIKPEARKIIMDYMNLYKEYC